MLIVFDRIIGEEKKEIVRMYKPLGHFDDQGRLVAGKNSILLLSSLTGQMSFEFPLTLTFHKSHFICAVIFHDVFFDVMQ